jgi:hypothetical protein
MPEVSVSAFSVSALSQGEMGTSGKRSSPGAGGLCAGLGLGVGGLTGVAVAPNVKGVPATEALMEYILKRWGKKNIIPGFGKGWERPRSRISFLYLVESLVLKSRELLILDMERLLI